MVKVNNWKGSDGAQEYLENEHQHFHTKRNSIKYTSAENWSKRGRFLELGSELTTPRLNRFKNDWIPICHSQQMYTAHL